MFAEQQLLTKSFPRSSALANAFEFCALCSSLGCWRISASRRYTDTIAIARYRSRRNYVMIICLQSRAQNDERRQTARTEVTSEQQAECPLTFAPSLVADAHFIKRTVNTPACLHMLLLLVHCGPCSSLQRRKTHSPCSYNTQPLFVSFHQPIRPAGLPNQRVTSYVDLSRCRFAEDLSQLKQHAGSGAV